MIKFNKYTISQFKAELIHNELKNIESIEFEQVKARLDKVNKAKFKTVDWFIKNIQNTNFNYTLNTYQNYPFFNKMFYDFYFSDLQIAVEIDDNLNEKKVEYNNKRDALIHNRNIEVFRIRYGDEQKLKFVIKVLTQKLIVFNNYKPIIEVKPKIVKKTIVSKFDNEAWNKMMMDALKK